MVTLLITICQHYTEMFHYFSIQQNAYQLQKIQGCFEAQLPKFNQCCVTNAISIVYQKPDILCILK